MSQVRYERNQFGLFSGEQTLDRNSKLTSCLWRVRWCGGMIKVARESSVESFEFNINMPTLRLQLTQRIQSEEKHLAKLIGSF
jgi:hypothetical protein